VIAWLFLIAIALAALIVTSALIWLTEHKEQR
jgi:hypothetical protein